jgi:GAF domain-containing protein
MSSDDTSALDLRARDTALKALAVSAASNIPGVDFASITVASADHTLHTAAATDPLAEQTDAIQYELREGPCYAAVTDERLVLVNDVATSHEFPRYGPRAADLGVRSQAAIQLIHNGEKAGLNLYSRTGAFDQSTVQFAELFATQAAALLGYAEQVEQLGEALHTRTDIGTAVGILMERYGMDRNRAFAFLLRNSSHRNVKVRTLAQQVIDLTFTLTSEEDPAEHQWP